MMNIKKMTTEYKNSKEPSHIAGIIKETLSSYTLKQGGGICAIRDKWIDAVGDKIAENARPSAIKKDILIVQVSSSTWLQHLSFLKKDIILKINESLGEKTISEIKYKIGNV